MIQEAFICLEAVLRGRIYTEINIPFIPFDRPVL